MRIMLPESHHTHAPKRSASGVSSLTSRSRTSRRRAIVATTVFVVAAALSTEMIVAQSANAAPGGAEIQQAMRADPSTSEQQEPTTVTADALPTPQINGVVWDQVVVGDTVYAGGNFTSVRPAGSKAGQDEQPRTNLLAYSLSTGELVTAFAPQLNGQVKTLAASPDGSTLYIGGQFTSVDAANRYRIAAINTSSGKLTNWKPTADATVNSIVATESTVYVGGVFSKFQLQPRTRTAAVDAQTAALKDWAPQVVGGTVSTMTVSPQEDKVILGGNFTSLNTSRPSSTSSSPAVQATRGMGAVDTAEGHSMPWGASATIRNGGTRASITALSSDDTSVYGAGYENSASRDGNLEGTFRARWSDGALEWLSDCHGDSYSIAPAGDTIYVANHAHFCGNLAGGGMSDYQAPDKYYRANALTKDAAGVLSKNTVGTGTYTNFAGQPSPELLPWLPKMNTGTFTGLNQGPWDVTVADGYVLYAGEFRQVNGKGQQGLVRFSTKPSSGAKQGPVLSGSDIVPTVSEVGGAVVSLSWRANWDRDDKNLRYQVIRDGDTSNPVAEVSGDSTLWNRPTVTAIDRRAKPQTTYSYQIRTIDPAGNATLGDAKTFTTTTAGQIEVTDYDDAVLSSQPRDYWSLSEAQGTRANNWVRNHNPITLGSNVVRHVAGAEVTGDGRASRFGVGTVSTGTGTAALQESAAQTSMTELWFRSESTNGGLLAASKSTTSSWLSSREVFNRVLSLDAAGTVRFSETAATSNGSSLVSSSRLNDGEWHHIVAGNRAGTSVLYVDGKLANSAPAATASSVNGALRIAGGDMGGSLAAVAKADIDNVALYSQSLSDETIATHYRIGAERPNVAPSADFELSSDGLQITADAARSTDEDGEIVEYSWSFGDGSTADGTYVTHDYSTAGTYTVELTVTDNDGATAQSSQDVTVAPVGAIASDEFNRSVRNAWGTADLGGAWTTRGSQANYSATPDTGASVTLAPGASRSAVLSALTLTDAEVTTAVTLDGTPTGAGVYPSVILRESASGSYTVRAWIRPNEPVQLQLLRGSTVVARASVPGLTVDAGQTLNLRATIAGQDSTTVTARAWIGDEAEPDGWPLAFTDGTDSIRAAGTVGLGGYQSGSAVANLTLSFDRFEATQIVAIDNRQARREALDADQITAQEETEQAAARNLAETNKSLAEEPVQNEPEQSSEAERGEPAEPTTPEPTDTPPSTDSESNADNQQRELKSGSEES